MKMLLICPTLCRHLTNFMPPFKQPLAFAHLYFLPNFFQDGDTLNIKVGEFKDSPNALLPVNLDIDFS